VNAEPRIDDESESNSLEFTMKLRYMGQSRIAMRGSFTGEIYRFSPEQPVLAVNISDAKGLLACNLFTVA